MTPSASTLPPPPDDVTRIGTLAYFHSPAHQPLRPRLAVLGISMDDAVTAAGGRHRGPQPQAVAISAALMATEARLRGRAQECLDRGLIEVSIWGRRYAEEAVGRTESTTHRLSHAARAFKQQALRDVRGEAEAVAATEDFRTGLASRRLPHGRDLARTGRPVR